jgi:hypothetical protein
MEDDGFTLVLKSKKKSSNNASGSKKKPPNSSQSEPARQQHQHQHDQLKKSPHANHQGSSTTKGFRYKQGISHAGINVDAKNGKSFESMIGLINEKR